MIEVRKELRFFFFLDGIGWNPSMEFFFCRKNVKFITRIR